MQTRRFGRTNHASTVAIFGAAALWSATQAEADAVMEQVIAAGVNHIDVAPSAEAEALLAECRARDVGTMIIKSVTQSPWGALARTHQTWYRPFTDLERVQQAVNFVLSQDVTGLCTAGDPRVLPLALRACQQFSPMSQAEQETLIATAGQFEPLFA
jgi:predicted aldo/keto reductase-like oxidoreductase